jgi:hypothetical protein
VLRERTCAVTTGKTAGQAAATKAARVCVATRIECPNINVNDWMLRTARLMWRLHSSLAAVGARPTTPHSSARQLPSLVYQSQIDYSRFVSVPPLQRRCVIVAAAGSGAGTHAEEAPSSAVAVELQQRVAKLLKSRLPSYCSGCGVKLQQDDADRPGYGCTQLCMCHDVLCAGGCARCCSSTAASSDR